MPRPGAIYASRERELVYVQPSRLKEAHSAMPISKLGKNEHKRIYYYLCLTRYTNEVSVKKYKQGQLQETAHSCMGEEAVAIGSGIQLRADDYVRPSLRGRGYFFAKGITSNEMMAGLYGKVTGPARGKNTSHHMGDMKRGVVCGEVVIETEKASQDVAQPPSRATLIVRENGPE